MGPTYVLHYFNLTGRAEAIRLLFHVAGVEFEDKQYSFQEWAALKGDSSKFPLSQMPTLQIDDKVVCQSLAIIRHLANELRLYGKSPDEKLITDQIMETLNDVFNAASRIKFDRSLDGEKKKEAFARHFEESTKSFNLIMSFVKQTNGVFTFGDEVSLADILLFSGYEFVDSVYPSILQKYPEYIELANAFREVHNVKSYLTSRKHSGMK